MNEEVYVKSGFLPLSQTIRKMRLRMNDHSLRLQSLSFTPHGSMLQHLNVVFSVRRGQGRTWTLVKEFLNNMNAIGCNIDDAINFSPSQFTCLVEFVQFLLLTNIQIYIYISMTITMSTGLSLNDSDVTIYKYKKTFNINFIYVKNLNLCKHCV